MTGPAFDLADKIRRVRAIKAKKKELEEAFEAKIKPYTEFIEREGAEVLAYLLRTNQKSASTVHGGVHWKEAVTYRVVDKDEFRQFVISENAWEMLTWAAAGLAAEEFTKDNAKVPPGTERNAIIRPYFTAPTKPRLVKKTTPTEAGSVDEMQDDPAEQEPESAA